MLSDVLDQIEGVYFLRRVINGYLKAPLLLVGNEGVGRRFSVLQAAKEMFCKAGCVKGCECYDCSTVDNDIHPDVTVICPVEDKDIGVDVVRSAVIEAGSYPSSGSVRFFVIDGADRMTIPAANAILKTLEEPPNTARFFLLAESYDRVLPTIRSRCGPVRYKKLPESLVISKIGEIEEDPIKALVLARMAEGSVGRAVSYWSSGRLKLRDQALNVMMFGSNSDIPSLFAAIDEIGGDLSLMLKLFDQLTHDLLMVSTDPTRLINLDIREQLEAMNQRVGVTKWIKLIAELKLVYSRFDAVSINLPFHVKSAFVQSFASVA